MFSAKGASQVGELEVMWKAREIRRIVASDAEDAVLAAVKGLRMIWLDCIVRISCHLWQSTMETILRTIGAALEALPAAI